MSDKPKKMHKVKVNKEDKGKKDSGDRKRKAPGQIPLLSSHFLSAASNIRAPQNNHPPSLSPNPSPSHGLSQTRCSHDSRNNGNKPTCSPLQATIARDIRLHLCAIFFLSISLHSHSQSPLTVLALFL